jgi:hypothetical protein
MHGGNISAYFLLTAGSDSFYTIRHHSELRIFNMQLGRFYEIERQMNSSERCKLFFPFYGTENEIVI